MGSSPVSKSTLPFDNGRIQEVVVVEVEAAKASKVRESTNTAPWIASIDESKSIKGKGGGGRCSGIGTGGRREGDAFACCLRSTCGFAGGGVDEMAADSVYLRYNSPCSFSLASL